VWVSFRYAVERDWGDITKRVGEMGRYGKEAKEWSVLLTPVINNMINSFNKSKSEEVNDFCLKACYRKGLVAVVLTSRRFRGGSLRFASVMRRGNGLRLSIF